MIPFQITVKETKQSNPKGLKGLRTDDVFTNRPKLVPDNHWGYSGGDLQIHHRRLQKPSGEEYTKCSLNLFQDEWSGRLEDQVAASHLSERPK